MIIIKILQYKKKQITAIFLFIQYELMQKEYIKQFLNINNI